MFCKPTSWMQILKKHNALFRMHFILLYLTWSLQLLALHFVVSASFSEIYFLKMWKIWPIWCWHDRITTVTSLKKSFYINRYGVVRLPSCGNISHRTIEQWTLLARRSEYRWDICNVQNSAWHKTNQFSSHIFVGSIPNIDWLIHLYLNTVFFSSVHFYLPL